MATIGQQLSQPEEGWKRYDDAHPAMKLTGQWSFTSGTTTPYTLNWNSTIWASYTPTSSMSFDFIGTDLRVIATRATSRTMQVEISIDGIVETFSENGNEQYRTLVYEKNGLPNQRHLVTITHRGASGEYLSTDAFDIIGTRIFHPDEVTDIKDLEVGKRIRCCYQAASGNVGVFSGLSSETLDFIPLASSTSPNGDFYWIMVEDVNKKKILIADRNIQHTISWDTLNTAGIASGSGNPTLTPLTSSIIPSLSAYTNSISNRNFIVTASTEHSSYFAWKAFNKDYRHEQRWMATYQIPYGWLALDTSQQTTISCYSITVGNASEAPKTWTFEGSHDGLSWTVLDTRTNITFSRNEETIYCNLTAKATFRHYRINITLSASTVFVGLVSFELYDKTPEFASVRLLTGGVSSTDKDNEWDKYIVNSTLNGAIVAGDNNIWNTPVSTVGSWTSSTSATQNTSRTRRGQGSIGDYFFTASSTATANTGFRPVLIIETLTTTRSVIRFDGKYKKWIEGNSEIVNTQDIIPKMTSDANGIITLSTNSNNANGFQNAYYVFDGLSTTAFANGASQYPCWLQVDIGEMKKVDKYSVLYNFTTVGSHMSNWDFQGSFNGSEWSTIDSQTISAWNIGETKLFTVSNPANYRYYRILMKAGTQYSVMSELQLISVDSISPATPAHWQTISTTLPSVDTFKSDGMEDLSVLDRKPTTFIDAMSDNGSLGNGKVFKKSVDVKKLFEVTSVKTV